MDCYALCCNIPFVVHDHTAEHYQRVLVQLYSFFQRATHKNKKCNSLLHLDSMVRDMTNLYRVSKVARWLLFVRYLPILKFMNLDNSVRCIVLRLKRWLLLENLPLAYTYTIWRHDPAGK